MSGREAHQSRGKGNQVRSSPGGRQDQVVPKVATLDRGPDQSQRVRPISPSHREPGGGPSWVEYRSGGTGDQHPGIDIFPDLSQRAKPYCGVKCSQGLHFPATTIYYQTGRETCCRNIQRHNEIQIIIIVQTDTDRLNPQKYDVLRDTKVVWIKGAKQRFQSQGRVGGKTYGCE